MGVLLGVFMAAALSDSTCGISPLLLDSCSSHSSIIKPCASVLCCHYACVPAHCSSRHVSLISAAGYKAQTVAWVWQPSVNVCHARRGTKPLQVYLGRQVLC